MIPLYHDFTGETVLVFGGGRVGARKARRFAREARVVVVSPTFVDADFGGAERVRAAPEPDEVDDWVARVDPALVVAATDDDAVNDAVERAAGGRGLLYNRADRSRASDDREETKTGERAPDAGVEPGDGDGAGARRVVVPATVEDGPVSVAVSTGGRSPALSKHLRERIESDLAGAGDLADLTGELRRRLRERGVAPAERRAAIRRVVRSSRVWKALRGGDAKARDEAERIAMQGTSETGDER